MALNGQPPAPDRLLAQQESTGGRLTTELSPPFRWAVRLLWIAGLAALTISTIAAAGGPGDPLGPRYHLLYLALFAIPGVICLLRALLVPEQRLDIVTPQDDRHGQDQ